MLVLLSAGSARAGGVDGRAPNVLVLNSYSPGYNWAEEEVDGFLERFRELAPLAVLFVEYLDWKNHPTKENLELFLEVARYRYADKKLDVVVAMDNVALDFALAHRGELFAGVPIVFCGINDFTPSLIAGHEKVTGVAERVNVLGTVQLMKRLHPNLREIVIILEPTESGRAMRSELEAALGSVAPGIGYRFLEGLGIEEVLVEVGRLPQGTLVLVDAFTRDGKGEQLPVWVATGLLSERSAVPVYGLLEYQAGRGIIGGWLLSSRQQGELAAQITQRVLAGEMPPPVLESPTRLVLDYEQLRRFGVPLGAVPSEAVLLKVPPAAPGPSWGWVMAVAGATALFLAFNLVLLVNVRRRLHAERTLRESESRFRAVVEHSSDLITTLRADGSSDYRSPSYATVLGYSPEEVAAVGWQIVHPDDIENARKDIEKALAIPGGSVRGQHRLRHKDGSWRWIESVIHNHLDDPAIGRLVVTGWDITERKQADEARIRLLELEQDARRQAEAANRSKDEFLAILSHELRTPLTPILGWARLLRTTDMSPEDTDQALEAIERNTRAQARLIEDLLDLSRIVTGKMQLEVRTVDLVEALESVLESLNPAATAKQIEIVRGYDAEEPLYVRGDPDRLQQVVWNLVSNAIKFTPRGGRVEVRAARGAEHVELVVRDNGEGIAPEQLAFLFTRFWQADTTATRRFGGLGLGLSIVRHLVELHGGSVSAESEGKGKGACFGVRLPASRDKRPAEQAPGAPSLLRPSPAPLERLRVLVVEDDRDTRDWLIRTLETHGAVVEAVATAAHALEAFRRNRPGLVLSDIGLPDEDGYRLLHAIRALPPEEGGDTPAIALTGYAHDDNRRQALDAGYQLHLAKPIEPAELAAAVAKLAASSTAR
ncbi:MAG: ABC transporter substrate binding protein [Myxococcales bacterium]